MGPVNWWAVGLAAALALTIMAAWDGSLFRRSRARRGRAGRVQPGLLTNAVVFGLAAVMLGHNFARIGAATLDSRPWLYFMQTGGVALFFVIPAVWLIHARNRAEPLRRVIDCGVLLLAYLAMGVVFWLMG